MKRLTYHVSGVSFKLTRNYPPRLRELPANPDPLARFDALGRKVPKGAPDPGIFGAFETFRAVPWLWEHFDKEVPEAFWALDVDSDGSEVLLVSCPCGQDPVPRLRLNELTQCPGESCGRTFAWLGNVVRVAGSPKPADSA